MVETPACCCSTDTGDWSETVCDVSLVSQGEGLKGIPADSLRKENDWNITEFVSRSGLAVANGVGLNQIPRAAERKLEAIVARTPLALLAVQTASAAPFIIEVDENEND